MKKNIIFILLNLGCWVGVHAQTPKKVTYTYDALNRLTEVTYPNGEKITYNYDVLGNRVSVVTVGSCVLPTATLTGTQTITAGQTANLSVALTGVSPWVIVVDGVTYNPTTTPYAIPVTPASTKTYNITAASNGCGAGTFSGSAIVTVNPVNNPCPPTIIHGTGVLAAGTYQASQTIDSKANISSPTTFKAGQSILLTNGFSAGPSETFLAMIGGCATAPTNGLVAYYPFNGNANDESGNNYHGTIDGATLGTDRKGVTNKAFNFNGTNGRIRVEDTPNLNFSSSFSISFWAKMNTWGNGTSAGIISKKINDPGNGYVIYNDGTYSNKLNFRLKSSSNTQNLMPSNTSVTIGSWECWTMVYNSTDGTNKLFRNGVLDKSYSTGNLGNMSSTAPLYFGYSQTWNGYLNGLLDEIRIYNRAITNDEVLQIYNAEKP
jgi:YD repeat-containing protein